MAMFDDERLIVEKALNEARTRLTEAMNFAQHSCGEEVNSMVAEARMRVNAAIEAVKMETRGDL